MAEEAVYKHPCLHEVSAQILAHRALQVTVHSAKEERFGRQGTGKSKRRELGANSHDILPFLPIRAGGSVSLSSSLFCCEFLSRSLVWALIHPLLMSQSSLKAGV